MSPRAVATPNESDLRRHRNREQARRAILDATESILVENGGKCSMRTLVRECGYTAPTIYHYFGDKQGLLDALLEERFAQLLARVERVEQTGDPIADLKRMAEAFLGFTRRNLDFYRLILTGANGRDRTPRSAEAAREIMERPLRQLVRDGRLRTSSGETAGQALWALLHGLNTLQLSRPDFPWASDLFDVAFDALLRGLLRDASPRVPAGT
jgi:AcrR family transcriptional regulator